MGRLVAGCRNQRRKEGSLAVLVGQTQGRNRKQNHRGCRGGSELTVPLGTPERRKRCDLAWGAEAKARSRLARRGDSRLNT